MNKGVFASSEQFEWGGRSSTIIAFSVKSRTGQGGCPRCQSYGVGRTNKRGVFERLLSSVRYYPHLCYGCGHRFVRRSANS